jgi:hypothetical protein
MATIRSWGGTSVVELLAGLVQDGVVDLVKQMGDGR